MHHKFSDYTQHYVYAEAKLFDCNGGLHKFVT